MLFDTLWYWLFFALVIIAYYVTDLKYTKYVIILASAVFYIGFSAKYLLLIVATVIFNFYAGLLIERAKHSPRLLNPRALATLAIAANLGVLALFKYWNLFVRTFGYLSDTQSGAYLNNFILPVAISFYTFENISYIVDVLRGDLRARKNIVDYTLFISFFPHLVSGPIIRPANFFPQIADQRRPDEREVLWSIFQITKGLLKKVVFADTFATTANAYFNGHAGAGQWATAWIAVFCFSMQIYYDFSGYTDIARGCARLLGYEFPPNFERPYLSAHIAEFWRRWHISLSTWLRDYVYISLGGNRQSEARTHFNLIATMALGGFWHGASWNFMLWGLYHGVLLSLHRLWRQRRPTNLHVPHALGVISTFLLVTLGWVLFRAPDFNTARLALRDMFEPSLSGFAAPPLGVVALVATSAIWLTIDRGRRAEAWLCAGGGPTLNLRASAAMALSLLALCLFSHRDLQIPFIYFQF